MKKLQIHLKEKLNITKINDIEEFIMSLEDMIDLIIMYEAREKGLEVYRILFDEPNSLLPALTTKEGVFGAFTRIESIIVRNSKLNLNMTLDVLESDNLSIEQKAKIIFDESVFREK